MTDLIQFAYRYFKLVVCLTCCVSESNCEALIADKACGTLYSEDSLSGNAFPLKDFDQSVNTKTDYRVGHDGWEKTGSIRVYDGCSMNVCNTTYFEGTCRLLTAGSYLTNQIFEPIKSANCTCARDCQCANTSIPKNPRVCGRAYLKGACNKCDSEYLPLECTNLDYFSSDYKNKVETIKTRSGCGITLVLNTNSGQRRLEFSTGFVQNITEEIDSYQIQCNDEAYVPPSLPKTEIPYLSLPTTIDDLVDQVVSDNSLATHPGLQAAFKSFKNGRSPTNVYIVVIGGFLRDWILLQGCPSSQNKIRESHISVRVDELGISNAELRVIDVPLGSFYNDGLQNDAQWIASLDNFLTNHEELRHVIPNAVVLSHYALEEIGGDYFRRFYRKLRAVTAMSHLILDKHHTNLHVLLESRSFQVTRNPEKLIEKFRTLVNNNFTFSTPIPFVTRDFTGSTTFLYDYSRINGHRQMDNKEYWPLNLQQVLVSNCEKAGDDLGRAVFNSVFVEEYHWTVNSIKDIDVLPTNNSKVREYKMLLDNSNIHVLSKNTTTIFSNDSGRILRGLIPLSLVEVNKQIAELEQRLAENERTKVQEIQRVKNEIMEGIKAELMEYFE